MSGTRANPLVRFRPIDKYCQRKYFMRSWYSNCIIIIIIIIISSSSSSTKWVVVSVAVVFNPHNKFVLMHLFWEKNSLHRTMLFRSKGDLFLRHDLTCVQIAFIYLSPCVRRHGNCFMPLNYLFSSSSSFFLCVGEDFEKKFQFEEGGNHSLVCDIRLCQLLLAHILSINFRSRFDG
jgi:hypothetical protein